MEDCYYPNNSKYEFLNDENWGMSDINLITGRVEPCETYPGDFELCCCRNEFDQFVNPDMYNITPEEMRNLREDFKRRCLKYYNEYPENEYCEMFKKMAEAC